MFLDCAFFIILGVVCSELQILTAFWNFTIKSFIFYRVAFSLLVIFVIAAAAGKIILIRDVSALILIFITAGLLILISFSLNKTLEIASASYATMMSMLLPVFVLIFSMLFFKEYFTFIQLLGGIIVIAAGVFTQWKKVAHHE
ncbi:MAG: EamA family transporter [bacterium]